MIHDDGLQAPPERLEKTPVGATAVHAHHEALRAEIATLRGVVAALRTQRARGAAPPEPRRFAWRAAAAGFGLGVLLTLLVVALLLTRGRY